MAVDLFDHTIGDRRLRAITSERSDGDFHPRRVRADVLDARQHDLIGRRFVMADQIHGTAVIAAGAGEMWPLLGPADVIVADGSTPRAIGVWAADCAPVVLFGERGTVIGAHAGWRGLASGIVDVAVGALACRGESVVAAVVGPLIHAECYPFGEPELAAVAKGVRSEPDAIRSITAEGHLALDVPVAVSAALVHHSIDASVIGACTGCDSRWFSHRARGERERHVLVAWTEPAKVRR